MLRFYISFESFSMKLHLTLQWNVIHLSQQWAQARHQSGQQKIKDSLRQLLWNKNIYELYRGAQQLMGISLLQQCRTWLVVTLMLQLLPVDTGEQERWDDSEQTKAHAQSEQRVQRMQCVHWSIMRYCNNIDFHVLLCYEWVNVYFCIAYLR